MTYRSKAPLRIGLAGGGTDVNPYASQYGGAVVNATVSLYAHASIEPLAENAIVLHDANARQELRFSWASRLPINGQLDLLKAVYNRIHSQYGLPLTGFKLTTSVDAPVGSGLGTSSTLVVAMVGAFVQMLALPLGSYDIAQLAYQIERHDLGFAGGHQDQYAASFGGINFMEFGPADRVVVNPLAVKPEVLFELENNLLLYYTGQYRQSGEIIMSQQQKVKDGVAPSIQAMHQLKQQAWQMKEALLKGRLQDMGELLETGFAFKKQMTEGISDPAIEQVYQAAMQAGATGGKISGAGGGGFMFFYCPGITRFRVATALQQYGGQIYPCHFTNQGMVSWAVR